MKKKKKPLPDVVGALVVVILSTVAPLGNAIGGEKAFFQTRQFNTSLIHRQDVCDRYRRYQNGQVELKDALGGMQLHVLLARTSITSTYITYDDETGLHPEYPGVEAEILDELARRGNFTWRDTFGIAAGDPTWSMPEWKELLLWGVETYDLNVGWWLEDLEDKKLGVSFVQPGWYDASPIMVGKVLPTSSSRRRDEDGNNNSNNYFNVNVWNWAKPYNTTAWMLIIFTIFVSSNVYMILEWFADERNGRTLYEWWLENSYLSAINITQVYEFQPKTLAARIFGVSMAIWALIVNATYTANLAAHLVNQAPPPTPQTIDEAALLHYRICIYPGSITEIYLRNKFPTSKLVYKKTVHGMYDAINTDECDYMVVTKAGWEKHRGMRNYNPNCDLYWVGGDRKIWDQSAGFATKVDSGHLCTGFIRDVLNIHMEELVDAGFLRYAWAREFGKRRDIDCNAYKPGRGGPQSFSAPEDDATITATRTDNPNAEDLIAGGGSQRRHLRRESYNRDHNYHQTRLLKAGIGATSGAVSALTNQDFEEEQKMSVKEMIGTFTLHWTLCVVSLFIACVNALYSKYQKRFLQLPSKEVVQDLECFPQSSSPVGKGGAYEETPSLSSSASLVEERRDLHLQEQIAAMEERKDFEQQMVAMEQRLQRHFEQQLQLHEQKLLQQLELFFQTKQEITTSPMPAQQQQTAKIYTSDAVMPNARQSVGTRVPSPEIIETFSDEPDGRQLPGRLLLEQPIGGIIPLSPAADGKGFLGKLAAMMEDQGSSTGGSQPRRRKQ